MDGRQTEDEQRLVDLGVGPGATIRLLFRLRGGLSGLTREGEGYGEERPTPGGARSNFQSPDRRGEPTTQRQSGWLQQAAPREREVSGLPKGGSAGLRDKSRPQGRDHPQRPPLRPAVVQRRRQSQIRGDQYPLRDQYQGASPFCDSKKNHRDLHQAPFWQPSAHE